MRAAPTLTVNVARAGGCRLLVAACAAASGMALAAWCAARWEVSPATTAALLACAGALASLVAWRASRLVSLRLEFDGKRWALQTAGGATQWPGRVAVTIDLGDWLLLRFDADGGAPAPRWLPLARRSLPRDWHALRCAIHAREAPADRLARADSSR